MRFDDERYVRLYTKDTIGWKRLPWQSRAVMPLLLRVADRAGLIELDEYGIEGLADLVLLPLEVVEPGLAGLVKAGSVERRGSTLAIVKFIEAQEIPMTDAQRKREQRARDRARVLDMSREPDVRYDVTPVTDVTDTRDTSRIGHSELRQDKPDETESESTRACVRERLKTGFAEVGIPMPDAQAFGECSRLVTEYAESTKRDGAGVANEAFAAAKKLSGSWSVKRLTPLLFAKHWDAIQQVMAGADPMPVRQGRAPPEPVARRYEDLGAIADRIGGNS